MNTKNYIIGAHRRIKNYKWPYGELGNTNNDAYEIYGRMYEISRASFRHFIEDDWEQVTWDEEIESIAYAMKMNWNNVYNLWHSQQPCNILAAGPDVMMVKPTKIFDRFNEFRMFNWTDPKQVTLPSPWNITIPQYFNGDFKYYPSTMSAETWAVGKKMADQWPAEENTVNNWGTEQIIENIMFWSQNLEWSDAHRPELFYQAFMITEDPRSIEYGDFWNQSKYSDAHVLHFHSSRGARKTLEYMEYIAKELGIKV